MSGNIEIARQYLAAYAAKDLTRIASLISKDVALQDWNIAGEGADFFLTQTDLNFQAATNIEIRIKSLHESSNAVAAELQIFLNNGNEEIHVVDVISIDSSNQISAVRAYKG